MDINSLKSFIENKWDKSALPALMEYISIPAVSPAFNPHWHKQGHLQDALVLAKEWCDSIALENAETRIISPPDKTPVLMIEIAATDPESKTNVLMYGHLDKQPESSGWDKNKGPWTPVIENGKLFGRGAADDGYSLFAAVISIKALQVQRIKHPRCVILIETCEESGSYDLEYYLDTCQDTIGVPDLVICLDSGCGDWDHLWITTSLRGTIIGQLTARILTQDIHSGMSGAVASSFRILRQILDRIEDAKTGRVLLDTLHTRIPDERMKQLEGAAKILGPSLHKKIPLVKGATAMFDDPLDFLINNTWRPAVSYIGADGLPKINASANVIRQSTTLLLSIRVPPLVDTEKAVAHLKKTIEDNTPYGAEVSFSNTSQTRGWNMPKNNDNLDETIARAASIGFDNTPCFTGEGGSIPFMTMLSQKFPCASFLITGVLGPNSNAHGPNEFLDIAYVKKLTLAVAYVIGSL